MCTKNKRRDQTHSFMSPKIKINLISPLIFTSVLLHKLKEHRILACSNEWFNKLHIFEGSTLYACLFNSKIISQNLHRQKQQAAVFVFHPLFPFVDTNSLMVSKKKCLQLKALNGNETLLSSYRKSYHQTKIIR